MPYNYYRPPSVAYQQGHGLGALFKLALPAVKGLIKSRTFRRVVKTAARRGPRVVRKYAPRAIRAGTRILTAADRKAAAKQEIQRALVRHLKKKTATTGRRRRVHRRDVFDDAAAAAAAADAV